MKATRILAVLATFTLLGTAWAAVKKRPAAISAAARAATRAEIDRRMAAVPPGFENPAALNNYYEALKNAETSHASVHILQFGDSHTASDDWVNAMRIEAQAHHGDGGQGFVQAGRPYKGFRHFNTSASQTTLWKTQGTMALRGDPNQGLSGVSISTEAVGQSVALKATLAAPGTLEVLYLQQPGGGQVQLSIDGEIAGAFPTDGELALGRYPQSVSPGPHEFTLRNLNFAPVRLYGWNLDTSSGIGPGITFETFGINGAQADVILGWNEAIWSAAVAARSPALIVLAYGTNEANSALWTADQYRANLNAILDRVHTAAPNASVLMVGPPDCGRLRPLLHLTEVIDIQREIARDRGAAFWDWRAHMGGPRVVTKWVTAGLSQSDYIHLTGDGYRLIGRTLFNQLESSSPDSHE